MDLDRQIQSPGGLPHGIEARIVNLHQLALLAQVKPQSLQNLQADRAFAFTLSQLAGLPLPDEVRRLLAPHRTPAF